MTPHPTPAPLEGLVLAVGIYLSVLMLTLWNQALSGVGAALALELDCRLLSLLSCLWLQGIRKGLQPSPCPLALRMDAVAAKLGAWPACRVGLLLALTDAAPLSAPAFSLVFPFLKMVLTEMPHHSEEEEERMAQILQILTVHAQLRASPSNPPGRVDEVGWGAQLPLGLSGVAGGRAGASDTS